MKLSNKPNIAAGVFLLVLSAFFSIAFMLQLLDFGSFGRGNLFFFTGKMLSSVYGFSSALIPLFLLAAALSCFASTWTVRRSVGLLSAVVPFFTSAAIEKICRALYNGASPFFEVKIALTLAVGLALIVIEFLAARLFADKIAASPAFKENFPDFEERGEDVEAKPHRLWNLNLFRTNTKDSSKREPESQQAEAEEQTTGITIAPEEQSIGIHSDSQTARDAEETQTAAEPASVTGKDASEPKDSAVPVNEPVQEKDDPFAGVFDGLEQPTPETVITKEEYAALTTPVEVVSQEKAEDEDAAEEENEIEELEWPDAYQIKAQAGNPDETTDAFAAEDDFIPPEADSYFDEEEPDVSDEGESPYSDRIEPDFVTEDELAPFSASPIESEQNAASPAEYLASEKPVLTDPYADGQDAAVFKHIQEQERRDRSDDEACFTELRPPLPPEPHNAGQEPETAVDVKKNDCGHGNDRAELDPDFFDIDMNAETQDELEARAQTDKIQFQISSDVFADMEADALQEVLAEQKTQNRSGDIRQEYTDAHARTDFTQPAQRRAQNVSARNNTAGNDTRPASVDMHAIPEQSAETQSRGQAASALAQTPYVDALSRGNESIDSSEDEAFYKTEQAEMETASGAAETGQETKAVPRQGEETETGRYQDETPPHRKAAPIDGSSVSSAPQTEPPHFENAVSAAAASQANEAPAHEETYITVRPSALSENNASIPREESAFRPATENAASFPRAAEPMYTVSKTSGGAGQSSLYMEENECEDSQPFTVDESAEDARTAEPGFRHSGVVPKPPYSVPSDLLTAFRDDQYWIIDDETKADARRLKSTLNEFRIEAEIIGIKKGPVVTMFELLPAHGVKLSKIVTLQDNIALRLAASSVRIVAPIPGRAAVGIEVPNKKRSIVSFREMIEQDLPEFKSMSIPVVLGKDILGKPQLLDLVKTPHLLIAGATGAGKSVCVNSMILSILYKRPPEQVRLILIDPKIVELKLYNNIPHLLTPVITESKRAFQSLQYCLCEMERRYSLLDGMGVRDITSYNTRIRERNICTEKLPYIVVIIDEFADLMATTGKELESTVARLAAMSRAVGIHLVLATQRPSIDVITGLIKANIPSRIAFMVASKMDSRIIIDQVGAEMLLGKGDMLYASAADPFPVRIQGTFVSDTDVENVVEYVKTLGAPDYIDDEIFVDDEETDSEQMLFQDGADPLYEEALDIVIQSGKASASYIQRRLKIGYNRAARLIEEMEERGIVGPANGSKPREIVHVPS
ncbi:MAG: DNA translocase FtsK [Treponema sp.]